MKKKGREKGEVDDPSCLNYSGIAFPRRHTSGRWFPCMSGLRAADFTTVLSISIDVSSSNLLVAWPADRMQ
jgi:hypothetical protein